MIPTTFDGFGEEFAALDRVLRDLRERMNLLKVDDDGQLRQTAAMLILKRGSRRR